MKKIIVDNAMQDNLLDAFHGAEFRDAQGRLLGRFVPHYDPAFFPVPGLDLTQAELDRRTAPDAKTYTTQEVLAYLRSLT
jgi:hypothetical protein